MNKNIHSSITVFLLIAFIFMAFKIYNLDRQLADQRIGNLFRDGAITKIAKHVGMNHDDDEKDTKK